MGFHHGSRLLGNVSVPAIASGGTESVIEQDGKYYRVHSFTTVGTSTLNVTRSGEVEYLIVAGGGGGGGSTGRSSGAGGAGGVITNMISVISNMDKIELGNVSVVVGDGGVGGVGDADGTKGNSSILPLKNGTLTAIGGGFGGRLQGGDGASGGGAGGASGSYYGGDPVTGQGSRGGNSLGNTRSSGGGGGYSQPGVDVSNSSLGTNGGEGINLSSVLGTSFGESGWFSGGGGGAGQNGNGNGGLGGGGDGNGGFTGVNLAESGIPNTGGGGGGSAEERFDSYPVRTGGNGGSGIVIIRYRITKQEYENS